jgi:hypothetical protein
MAIAYRVYSNSGAGDPVNYAAPAGTGSALTWTSAPCTYPGTWSFGVRAADTLSGLEEQNIDAVVTITLDPSGNDITNQPPAPVGLRGFAIEGGAIRIEWTLPTTRPAKTPVGFNVFCSATGLPDYETVVATVPYGKSIANAYVCNLSSLTSGATYRCQGFQRDRSRAE